MTSLIPTYNVQIDSRYRDVQNYPNPTDFAVSFKSPSSTGTYVQGLPINAGTGSATGNGFFSPLQIDPDFNTSEFKVINGTIQNLKAIDADNILACGLVLGTPFSAIQGNVVLISTTSSFTYVPVFLLRMSRNSGQWTLNWMIFSYQGTNYPIQDNTDNVTRATFQIDSQNNIFFAFDFNVPQFDIRIITPQDIVLYTDSYIGTPIYKVKNPTDGLKCLGIFSFDQNGGLNYINGHPWGYHILSSNNNMEGTMSNGRFNLEVDTALSLYVSGNTNPFKPKIYKTVLSTGSPSYDTGGKLYNFKKPGSSINYGIFISSPNDDSTKNVTLTSYNLDTSPPTIIQTYVIGTGVGTNYTVTGFGPINPFPSIKGIDFTGTLVGGKRNYYFFFYPADNINTSYKTFVIGYDIITDTLTTFINDASAYDPHTRPGWGTSIIYYPDLTTVYIFAVDYAVSSGSINISSWNPTTPSVNPTVVATSPFIPWNFPVNLYNFYFGFDSIVYQYSGTKYIYYIIGAISSAGKPNNDPYSKNNPYTIIRYNPNTLTSTTLNFISYGQSTFYLFERSGKLYYIAASVTSGIYEIDPAMVNQPTLLSTLNAGYLIAYPSPYVINGSYYVVFNLDSQGIVYNIDDMTKPYIVNQNSKFPLLEQGQQGSVNGIATSGDKTYAYGLVFDGAVPANSWFFKCDWLTNDVTINSSHYNQNIDGYLSIPENYIYSIDSISLNYPNVISNSLLFNPSLNLSGKLSFWFDASVANSIILAGNKVQSWIDISYNGLNLVQVDPDFQPIYLNNSVIFDATFQTNMLGKFISNKSVKYIAVVYNIQSQNNDNIENVVGIYSTSNGITPKLGIGSYNYNSYINNYNYIINSDNSYPNISYEFNINNGNTLNISDFGYDTVNSNVSLFLDGVTTNDAIGTPDPSNNVSTTDIINLGGLQTGNLNWSGITSSYNGEKLFACVNGGYIYSSINSGTNWIQLNSSGFRNWSCIAYGSTATTTPILVAAENGGYIYISNDDGFSFTQLINAGSRNWNSITISKNGGRVTATVSGGFIFTSINVGSTWIQLTAAGSRNWNCICSSDDGSVLIATVSSDLIYISKDFGTTWNSLANAGTRNWSSVCCSNDGKEITATVDGGYIYQSNDYGDSWYGGNSNISTYISYYSSDNILAASVFNNYIYVSSDNGVSWIEATNGGVRKWIATTIQPSSQGGFIAAITQNGYIYTSEDLGNTFIEQINSGIRNWSAITSLSSGSAVYLAATVNGGGIYVSNNKGITWDVKPSSGALNLTWSSITSVFGLTSSIYIAACVQNGYIYTSTNNGDTFTQRNLAGSRNWISITSVFNSSSSSWNIAAADYGGNIYTSTDGGVNWTQQIGSGTRNWTSITSSLNLGVWRIAATVSGGNVYTSNDGGVTWIAQAGSGSRVWSNIVSSSNGSTLFSIINNADVYKSTDIGITWNRVNGSDIKNYKYISCDKENTLISAVVNNEYIYISNNGGFSWVQKTSSGVRSWNRVFVAYGAENISATTSDTFIYISFDDGNTWSKNTPQIYGYFSGSIKEIIGMNEYPDSSTRSQIQSYLAYKWNCNTYISYTNPFKQKSASIVYNPMVTKYDNTANISIYNSTNLQNITLFDTLPTTSCSPLKNWSSVALSSSGQYQTIVGSDDFIYVSNTYGNSWNTIYIKGSWSSAAISSSGRYQSVTNQYGLIYRSTDFGVTWNGVETPRNWISIAINRDSSTSSNDGKYQIAAVNGGQLYTSSDFGGTWIARDSNRAWSSAQINGTGQYMTATVNGGQIYRSIDFGVTWSAVESNRAWSHVDLNYTGNIQTSVVNGGQIYVSTDFGVTWNATFTPLTSNFSNISSTYSGANWLIATSAFDNTTNIKGYIYTSTNGGSSWTEQTGSGFKTWTGLSSTYLGGVWYLVGAVVNDYIYISIDNGVNWTRNFVVLLPSFTPAGSKLWNKLTTTTDGANLFIAATVSIPSLNQTGYIYTSTNGGLLWTEQTTSGSRLWTDITNVWTGANWYIAATVDNQKVYTSTNGGATWTAQAGSGDKKWTSISSIWTGANWYIVATVSNLASFPTGQDYVYTSTDGGVTWTQQTTIGLGYWTNCSSIWDGVNWNIVVVGAFNVIYTSNNGGVNWTARVTPGVRFWTDVTSIWDGVNWRIAATSTPGNVWTSIDGGVNWTHQTSISNKAWNSVALSNSGTIQAATVYGGQIYESIDSGVTWNAKDTNKLWTHIDVSDSGVKQTVSVENNNIYLTNDTGLSWNYNSPIDVYHIINPYDINGGYYVFYLDTSGYYVWRCNANLEFFSFVTENHFDGADYQFNCWKLIPYTDKNNNLFFIILFKNGKVRKFKLASNGVVTEPVAPQTLAINKNLLVYGSLDVLSSGEVYKYDDGTVYLFALVGSKTYTLNVFLDSTLGYIYFCNITNENQFDFNSDVTKTYTTISTNSRASSIYRYPDGTPYLIIRAVASPTTKYINISDYSNFVYPYTNLTSVSAGGGAGYAPPIPWIPLEIGSPNSISYEDGLSGASITLDMYKNPVNNSIFSLQPESGDTTSFLFPLDDQQFYINDFDFTNIVTPAGNNKFPFYGSWAQVNLSNINDWYGCAISYSGQYILTLEASGKVYRSTDYGTGFSPVTSIPAANWFTCYITHDKDNPANDGKEQLVVGANYYIYRSTDFGATFSPITTLGVKNFISASVSSDGRYLTATENNGYLWRSSNSGANWNNVSNVIVNGSSSTGVRSWYITTMNATGSIQAVTASSDFIYLSNDYGVTWANPNTDPIFGIPTGSYFGVSMTLDGQYLMVAQIGGAIRQSANYGSTWLPSSSAGANLWFDVDMSSNPTTAGLYRSAVPGLGNIYVSTGAGGPGVEYTQIANTTQSYRNVTISGDGQYQIATANNGLRYITTDFAKTWNPIGNRWNGVAMSYNSQFTTILDKGGYIYTSSDYSMTFTQRDTPRDWERVAINQYQAPLAGVTEEVGKYQTATVDGGQIYRSSDYGKTWTARDSNRAWRGVSIGYSGQYQTAVVEGGQIYTSSDYGVNWTARDSNRAWVDVSINTDSGADDSKYQTAVVKGGQIYTSSNFGVTWTARDSNRQWSSVAISSNGVYQTAVVNGGYIYRSTDSGVSWVEVTSAGIYDWSSIAMSSNGSVQIAVTNGDKIYVSTDYGVTWVENFEAKQWTDVAISANGVNRIATANIDFVYNFYSTRATQVKHGTLGQKSYSSTLLTNILNGKGGGLVYYTDVSNAEYATENYRRSNGSYPSPITESFNNISSIGVGFVNKLDNEGISDWLTYYGGNATGYYGLNTNISNITIDKSLTYLYTVGGWEQKIQSFYTNSTGTFTQLNEITSLNSGYNGFISKIDIIDGKVEWLTPMIGPASDYIEKIQYIASKNELAIISHFDSTILLLYNKQLSSTGPWSNPVRTILNIGNTSVETSSVITLDTESEYKWHTLLYSDEESRNVTLYDISIDESNENKTVQVVGITNANQVECTDSSGVNVQKLYSKIDPFTQKEVFIYGFGIDGIYQHSNKLEFSPNVVVEVQDIKSFSNSNQIYVFPNYKTNSTGSNIKVYNRDGTLAKTLNIISSSNPVINEVAVTCCQPISYLYNPQYIGENGIGYSRIVYQPDGSIPTGLPTSTDSLTNYNLYIQGPLLSTSTNYSSTTKTLTTSPSSILDKNFSIRGNYIDTYMDYNISTTIPQQRYNVILNQEIDVKNLDRNNLPYQYTGGSYTYTEWQGSITKSPINDIIAYDTTLLPNSQNRLTITNLYGNTLTTYTSATGTGVVPYYIYFPNGNEPSGIKTILVTSVTYSSSTQTYFLTIANLNDLKVNGSYYGPYLYLSKKNVSALYTLQFYPAALNSDRIYYVSINNLIIPNRPIRNTNLPGVRYLTDLPYIYLSVYNTNDNGEYSDKIVNNFFSNNVSKGFNAVFEVPMKYATVNENFVVLSATTKPKILFKDKYYNIRCTLTDPDGNVLLLDNTPYKPGDAAFTGGVVPDMLMNCNISLVFEPTEFILTN